MKRTNAQSERQNYIDMNIREGKYPSVPRLSTELEVSEKTIKRDIEFLRDRLLAPIEYDRKKRGYFYSEPSWGIPSLILKEQELVSLLLGKSALEQYQDLGLSEVLEHLFERVLGSSNCNGSPVLEIVPERFSFVSAAHSDRSQVLNVLCKCLLNAHRVQISVTNRKVVSPGIINPLHLSCIDGEWILFASSGGQGLIFMLPVAVLETVEDSGQMMGGSSAQDYASMRKLLMECEMMSREERKINFSKYKDIL